MAASSPSFDALDAGKSCRLPVRKAAVADQRAPSVSIPLRFILTGVGSMLLGVICLVAHPDLLATYHYNQYVVAVTHLFVLGWICSVIMGAMYQLVPVALETRLHSEKLARWHFVLHTVGFLGMVATFWIWNLKQVGHFGSAVALGVGCFVYNLARTLKTIPRWNVVAVAIASALVWLSLAVLAGLFIATVKCWPQFGRFDSLAQMHAHAHLGVVGFFVMMIVGVSYKLVPMFTLGELQNPRRAGWSIGLLNASLAGLFVTILLKSPWKLAFAQGVIAALAVYAVELRAILRARRREKLDWGLRYFVTAVSLLAPVSVLAVILCWPGLPLNERTGRLENAYGFLGLVGVVGFAILGLLYKIVPFLVWYASYSKAIGRRRVPSLGELYSARLQAVGYWTFLTGLIAASGATLLASERAVQSACAVLAVGVFLFALNLGRILRHLLRPRLEPLPPRPAPTIPAAIG